VLPVVVTWRNVIMSHTPIDPLMRGYKLSVSISMPSALLQAMTEYQQEHRFNVSAAACRLIRLGLTYSEMLEEQKKSLEKYKQETFPEKQPPKKRSKPKSKPKKKKGKTKDPK
jgi:hypothetical protein